MRTRDMSRASGSDTPRMANLSTKHANSSIARPTTRKPRRIHADPWAFRRSYPLIPREGVADHEGRVRHVSVHIRNGALVFSHRRWDELEAPSNDQTDPEAERVRLRVRIQDFIDKYRRAGLTAKQLFVIEKTLQEGWSLHQIARAEGVAVQAIRERIEGNKQGHGGLKKRAPGFYAWWSLKQRSSRRRR
jgi:hypothetical protein